VRAGKITFVELQEQLDRSTRSIRVMFAQPVVTTDESPKDDSNCQRSHVPCISRSYFLRLHPPFISMLAIEHIDINAPSPAV
jgi:hypothetical protein